MRGISRNLKGMKRVRSAGVLLIALAMLTGVGSKAAPSRAIVAKLGQMQQGTRPNPAIPQSDPRMPSPGLNDPGDPLKDRTDSTRARAFNTERQKKLVADTDKLLQLATELKGEVDKSTKDEMSLAVIKKAGDIEKLAHDVKEKMKGS
jgi:hypothetical protein